ncbi:MAG: LysR family transcriptional regulator [Myxococcota bacterium]
MDWRTIGFDWNRARAFLVTAEEGSFSAAARALGSTQPTIGRQVSALEDELGVTLFERVGTRLVLTNSGVELLEHIRQMGEAASRASLTAAGQSTAVAGWVGITASEVISAFLLPPVIAELRVAYPGIQLELVASNAIRDLHRREADIAIRNVRPTHPDLIGRRMQDATAGLYAAPAYIARAGPFETRADLLRAAFLSFDQTRTMIDTMNAMGIAVRREQFPVIAGNHLVQWAMCRQGVGVGFIMTEIGDQDPEVVPVVPDFAFPIEMWLVCHRELYTSRRLRIVFDRLADALSERKNARRPPHK